MRTISDVISLETLRMFYPDFYCFFFSVCVYVCIPSIAVSFFFALFWFLLVNVSMCVSQVNTGIGYFKNTFETAAGDVLKSDILVKTKNDRVDDSKNPLRNVSLSYLGICQRRLEYKAWDALVWASGDQDKFVTVAFFLKYSDIVTLWICYFNFQILILFIYWM